MILRLAAIYGPGRGVRERLKKGDYSLIDDGIHWFSRVHVDDLVGVIRASAERAPRGARYCVADDRPSTQREYTEWLCARMGLPLPPTVASLAPGAKRRPVRNRKISNHRLHEEPRLHVSLSELRGGRAGHRSRSGCHRRARRTAARCAGHRRPMRAYTPIVAAKAEALVSAFC